MLVSILAGHDVKWDAASAASFLGLDAKRSEDPEAVACSLGSTPNGSAGSSGAAGSGAAGSGSAGSSSHAGSTAASKPGFCAVAGQATEDPRIDAMSCAYLEAQLRDEDETQVASAEETATRFTLPWHSEGSARFMPVLLFHQIKERVGVSGLVVLQLDESTQFNYPGELASELSRLCHEKGDLTVHLLG